MKILKTTDRVTFKCGEISVTASPISYEKKLEAAGFYKQGKDGQTEIDSGRLTAFLVKHSVKDIRGIKNWDDTEYQVKLSNGVLDDESVDVAITALTTVRAVLSPVLSVAQQQVPSIVNPTNGEPIDGVTMEIEVGK